MTDTRPVRDQIAQAAHDATCPNKAACGGEPTSQHIHIADAADKATTLRADALDLRRALDGATQASPRPAWTCRRCGSDRWVGWRANPIGLRRAQCVPCGYVQALPESATQDGAPS